MDVEAGNGDGGLGVKGVDGVEDGVTFRIGVEGVLGAVWVRVVVVDGCGSEKMTGMGRDVLVDMGMMVTMGL